MRWCIGCPATRRPPFSRCNAHNNLLSLLRSFFPTHRAPQAAVAASRNRTQAIDGRDHEKIVLRPILQAPAWPLIVFGLFVSHPYVSRAGGLHAPTVAQVLPDPPGAARINHWRELRALGFGCEAGVKTSARPEIPVRKPQRGTFQRVHAWATQTGTT